MGEIYDKAKYHFDSCEQLGLSYDQAFVHTGLYVAWLVSRGFFEPDSDDDRQAIKDTLSRVEPPCAVYEWYDGTLYEEMLTKEGNAFSNHYFHFDHGQFLGDYEAYAAFGLPSMFHVPNNWEAYDRLEPVFEARYSLFKGGQVDLPAKPQMPTSPAKPA